MFLWRLVCLRRLIVGTDQETPETPQCTQNAATGANGRPITAVPSIFPAVVAGVGHVVGTDQGREDRREPLINN
jgi:hypothetical protein